MSNEGLVLDNLALNDENPWRILDGTFQFTPARKKLNWASSAMSDGAALIGDEDHYENAEMTFRLRMEAQNSPDTGFALLNTLTQKLQAARGVRGGLPLTWTPANSSNTLTLYVLDAEYDELPMAYEEGWTTQAFQLVVHLFLRPFLYGFEQQLGLGITDSFAYDSITNGGWRIETGTGTVAVSGGNLTVSSTAAKRLYRAPWVTDSVVTMRFRTGTSTTGLAGAMLKHLGVGTAGALDRLAVLLNSTNLQIQKVVSNTSTILASAAGITTTTSTWYWLQASVTGNDITASLYADAQDPLNNSAPVPLATVSYTLSGADATKFGEGIRGQPGLMLTPSDNSWLVDQYTLGDTPDIYNNEPVFGFEVPQVEGHVSAEGRLVVSDGNPFGGVDRAHFEWGLESRNYDQTAVWPLLIDSDAMTTASFAGTQGTAFAGAYDPNATGNTSITADDISETVPLTVCSFGSQSHVGVFKVKVRVRGTEGIRCRLTWRIGDGQAARNDYSISLSGVDWQEVDLGTINIPEAAIGDQAWTGRIEAVGVSAGSVTIDYAQIIPVERYGVARAPLRPITPTVYSAFDNFNQTAGTLNAKTLDSGQAWATSGAAGDFVTTGSTAFQVQRTTVSDAALATGRYALAGTTNYAGVQAQADVGVAAPLDRLTNYTGRLRLGVILRYIDANNWLVAVREVTSTQVLAGIGYYNHNTFMRIYKRVAGTVTLLGSYNEGTTPDIHRTVICQIDAAGVYQVYSFHPGTQQPAEPQIVGQDTVLATSGTLSDGKIGLNDAYSLATPAVTRTYDNFVAFDSQAQVVIYATKHLEVRADRTERESGSVNQYGRVPMYRGDRFLIPKAEGVSRVAVKARRNDVDGGLPDNAIADFILVSVYATPRFLVPS